MICFLLIILSKSVNVRIYNDLAKYRDAVISYKANDGIKKDLKKKYEQFNITSKTKYEFFFSISSLCKNELTYIQTVNYVDGPEAYIIINLKDDLIAKQCQSTSLYDIFIHFNFVDRNYQFSYKVVNSSSEPIDIQQTNYFLLDKLTSPITIDLYVTGNKCNYTLVKQYTAQENSLNVLYGVPNKCYQEPNFICFDLSDIQPDIDIYYREYTNEKSYKLENKVHINKTHKFGIYLYSKSKYCPNYMMIKKDKYYSSQSLECIRLNNSDISDQCKYPMNYISIKNEVKIRDIMVYVSEDEIEYTSVYSSYQKNKTGNFECHVYIKSEYCGPGYVKIKTIQSKEYKSTIELIDDDIPEKCQKHYEVCMNIDVFPQYIVNYTIMSSSYSRPLSENITIKENGITNITNKVEFTLYIYYTKSECPGKIYQLSFKSEKMATHCNDLALSNLVSYKCPSNSNEKSNQKSKGLSGGAIAGIVIGCVAAVAIIGLLIWFFVFHRWKPVGNGSSDEE